MSTHLLTGNCMWTSIGGAGGLTANSTITGTSTSDWIVLPSSSVSACGWTIAPLNLNGRTLTINGVGGGDEIDAGAAGTVVVNGGSGNDYIRSTGFGHSFWGGTGNDNLNGRSGSNLRGESDNDAHCVAPGYTANVINGSTGTDTRCGNATTIAGIDSVNCNPCFF
jgi:hypothetical protein